MRDDFIHRLQPIFKELYKQKSATFYSIWSLDEEIVSAFLNWQDKHENGENISFEIPSVSENLNSLAKQLDSFFEKFINDTKDTFKKSYNRFEEAYQISGTIELPKRLFDQEKIIKKHHDVLQDYTKQQHLWDNTLFALFEDWKLSKEVYNASILSYQSYFNFVGTIDRKVKDEILPKADQITGELIKAKDEILTFVGDISALKNHITERREELRYKLSSEIIPGTVEDILSQNIPSLVDEFEFSIRKITAGISNKRAIVKSENFEEEIRDAEIDYISPQELIMFDKLPGFVDEILNVKNKVVSELNNIQKSLTELEEISDFNLESAIAVFENELDNQKENAQQIASEGLDRAITKSNEVKSEITNISAVVINNLSKALNNFRKDLVEFTNTENVFNIKLRIAKAKAIERTKAYKRDIGKRIKNALPLISGKIKEGYTSSKKAYESFRDRFGLAQHHLIISSEVSDFLAETNAAIQRLPFVYRRLFQIEALYDERFFSARDNEFAKINSALASWEKGFFAPVAIVGEKGSGSTSLINLFLKNLKPDIKERRTALSIKINDEKQFISFMKMFFENNEFTDINSIANYLNSLAYKQIVIIENLQQMYTKKVDGFKCLKMLFELISKTNKNVFWILSCSLYAWSYLNKTIAIADNLGYVIELENLNDDQIIEIITRRHRVSGYKLVFLASEADMETKVFKKLNEDEKQAYIRKEYFSSLNKFAKSNISLALLFWLRSTKEVTSDTITINSLNNLNFSFLSSLSAEKLFTLYALILHDGLSDETHSIIFGQSLTKSQYVLRLLQDDGIIIKNNDFFVINPLLYRQTVNLLHSKNIIH